MKYIIGHIQERNPSSVKYVISTLLTNEIVKVMKLNIMERSLTNVKNVKSVLMIKVIYEDTNKSTLRRSVYNVLSVANGMDGYITSKNTNVRKDRKTKTIKNVLTVESVLEMHQILKNIKMTCVKTSLLKHLLT